jgi:hypothetical protein
MHTLAVYAITPQLTKAAVDGACVLIRGGPTPALEPCYGRALTSGAIAGFAGMCIADASFILQETTWYQHIHWYL